MKLKHVFKCERTSLNTYKDASQADVAKAIGVTRTAYVKYETGASKPIRKLHELANYLNLSADYLLGNEAPQETPISLTLRISCSKVPLGVEVIPVSRN